MQNGQLARQTEMSLVTYLALRASTFFYLITPENMLRRWATVRRHCIMMIGTRERKTHIMQKHKHNDVYEPRVCENSRGSRPGGARCAAHPLCGWHACPNLIPIEPPALALLDRVYATRASSRWIILVGPTVLRLTRPPVNALFVKKIYYKLWERLPL